jgi:hypothetical protein
VTGASSKFTKIDIHTHYLPAAHVLRHDSHHVEPYTKRSEAERTNATAEPLSRPVIAH